MLESNLFPGLLKRLGVLRFSHFLGLLMKLRYATYHLPLHLQSFNETTIKSDSKLNVLKWEVKESSHNDERWRRILISGGEEFGGFRCTVDLTRLLPAASYSLETRDLRLLFIFVVDGSTDHYLWSVFRKDRLLLHSENDEDFTIRNETNWLIASNSTYH